MTRYGEVVRLKWRTLSGKFTLIALTPLGEQLDKVDCWPGELDSETLRLRALLREHVVSAVSEMGGRRGLRLLSRA